MLTVLDRVRAYTLHIHNEYCSEMVILDAYNIFILPLRKSEFTHSNILDACIYLSLKQETELCSVRGDKFLHLLALRVW